MDTTKGVFCKRAKVPISFATYTFAQINPESVVNKDKTLQQPLIWPHFPVLYKDLSHMARLKGCCYVIHFLLIWQKCLFFYWVVVIYVLIPHYSWWSQVYKKFCHWTAIGVQSPRSNWRNMNLYHLPLTKMRGFFRGEETGEISVGKTFPLVCSKVLFTNLSNHSGHFKITCYHVSINCTHLP